jgi:hypothetical protein
MDIALEVGHSRSNAKHGHKRSSETLRQVDDDTPKPFGDFDMDVPIFGGIGHGSTHAAAQQQKKHKSSSSSSKDADDDKHDRKHKHKHEHRHHHKKHPREEVASAPKPKHHHEKEKRESEESKHVRHHAPAPPQVVEPKHKHKEVVEEKHKSEKHKGHGLSAAIVERVAFCSSCRGFSHQCGCAGRIRKICGIDGHNTCVSPLLISAIYGFNLTLGTLNWTMTSGPNNTMLLAPTGTLAAMQAQFGFSATPPVLPITTPITRVGQLVFICGMTGANASLNTMFMIVRLPNTTSETYLLKPVSYLDDPDYRIGVGDYVQIRLGVSALVYRLDSIAPDVCTAVVSFTNYSDVTFATRVTVGCETRC